MITKLFAGGSDTGALSLPAVTDAEVKKDATPAAKPAAKQAKRIYEVTNTAGLPIRLVRAQNRNQAIAHVVTTTFFANVPTQDRLVDLVGDAVAIESAGD